MEGAFGAVVLKDEGAGGGIGVVAFPAVAPISGGKLAERDDGVVHGAEAGQEEGDGFAARDAGAEMGSEMILARAGKRQGHAPVARAPVGGPPEADGVLDRTRVGARKGAKIGVTREDDSIAPP